MIGYPKKLRRQLGFSLTQMLMAAGVTGVVVTLGSQYTQQIVNNRAILEANGSLDIKVNLLSSYMAVREFLDLSASDTVLSDLDDGGGGLGNRRLRDCIRRNGIDCQALDWRSQTSFNYFARENEQVTRVLGDETDPVYYSRNMQRCREDDQGCRFWQANAFFWTECSVVGGARIAQCDQAQVIHVRFQITPTESNRLRNRLPSWPPRARFAENPREFGFTTEIIPLQRHVEDDCPPNSRKVGEDFVARQAECECIDGFVAVGLSENGKPNCRESGLLEQCPEGKRPVGLDESGRITCIDLDVPVCQVLTFNDNQYRCVKRVSGRDVIGWIESIDPGSCSAPSGGGKKGGGSYQVRCDANRVKCCWYW